MPTINICICTYLRPKHLEKCLLSVLAQPALADASYTVTVIDNDADRTAEAVVKTVEAPSHTRLYYYSETNRGIPHARNRALDESTRLGSDFVVFIDDDECVSSNWLETLYNYLRSHPENTIVHGQVIPVFPEGTPEFVQEIYCSRKVRSTGSELSTCATDNVIFPLTFVQRHGIRFDTSNPLAGGTDTKFFCEAHRLGAKIYQCAEASVDETVFPQRLKMKWLIKRKYRSGITSSWRKRSAGSAIAPLLLVSTAKAIGHSILSLLLVPTNLRVARNRNLLRSARYAGIIAGALGRSTNSYQQIDS
jgi:succinoglycan biosynthesis protein ExoM